MARSTDIEALTKGLVAYDEAAFRRFHEAYFDRLYRFLLVVTSGRELETQEALQETLVHVARSPKKFSDEEAFWRWLKTVARNAARDSGRKRTRYSALLERFALFWGQDAPEESAETDGVLNHLLADSLSELSPEERSLVERKYLKGVSMKKLSTCTGLTERAVESKLLRLRRRLRERLISKLNNL